MDLGVDLTFFFNPPGPLTHYEKHGVRHLHLPTVDTAAPTLKQVHRGVAFIEDFLESNPGRRVFIHCKGGRCVGRDVLTGPVR